MQHIFHFLLHWLQTLLSKYILCSFYFLQISKVTLLFFCQFSCLLFLSPAEASVSSKGMALWLIKMTALHQPSHSRTPGAVRARGHPRVPAAVTEAAWKPGLNYALLIQNPSWREEDCKAHQLYVNIRHFYSPPLSSTLLPVNGCL